MIYGRWYVDSATSLCRILKSKAEFGKPVAMFDSNQDDPINTCVDPLNTYTYDVCVRLHDGVFYTHKLFLCGRSDYFRVS